MLVQALQAHNDPNGTAPKQLFQWMAATYPLQANFRPSASQALQKAFKRGRFEKNKEGKYRLNASWEGGNVSVLLLEGNRIIITFLFYSRQLEGRQGDHRATQKQSQILVPRLTLQQILRHTHHNAILGNMVARSFLDHPHIVHYRGFESTIVTLSMCVYLNSQNWLRLMIYTLLGLSSICRTDQ